MSARELLLTFAGAQVGIIWHTAHHGLWPWLSEGELMFTAASLVLTGTVLLWDAIT